jgi:hypothetical protein
MSKKLQFDLTVESNALLCPNPREWFVKATLSNADLAEFRQVPNVKEKTKLGVLTFTDPIQAFGCSFSATASDLNAVDIEPCKLSIMTQICQDDLESSFIADWMRAGSNMADFAPANFMSHYYTVLADKVKDGLAVIAWQGDTDSTVYPYELCDGLEKKLLADATVIDVANTTVTASNVMTEIAKVVTALPNSIAYRKSELRLFVSTNVAIAFQIASASLSASLNYVGVEAPLAFAGIKIVVAPGMSDDTMVCTLANNLIYAYDLLGDVSEIVTINMKQTTGDANIRTRTDFKAFFGFTNGEEIVYYN